MKKTDLAFTRIELLFCFLGATLVLIPAVSLLGSNKSESQRIVCFNNLRQIGQGFLGWANDHSEMLPWQADPRDGGAYQQPGGDALFWQFSFVSNYLGSPKVLVCPADTSTTKVAEKWRLEPDGLSSINYRNNAISYLIGLHALAGSGTSLLSGDRNMGASGLSGCSYLSTSSSLVRALTRFDENVRWTNAIHGTAGHLLYGEGSVQYTTTDELRAAVNGAATDTRPVHCLAK